MGAKYLFVINSFLAGGAERSLLELLPRLTARGISSIVAYLRPSEVGFEQEARHAEFDVRLLSGSSRVAQIRALRRLVDEERPDLVYSVLFDADLASRFACMTKDVPVVSCLANTSYDPARLADPNVGLLRFHAARLIDGVTARHLTTHFHAVSEAVKESTIGWLRVPADRITVVRRGRDVQRLGERSKHRRAAVRERLQIASHEEVVIAVGRQEFQKGHRFLVEAFAGVVSERPHARLLLVGREGHVTPELRDVVVRHDLGSEVRFLGHRHDVGDVLASADLFAFPSLYEGLGGALIEAMALSLPVVASDLPAIREIVVAGENADLVSPGDVDGLRTAITSLLGDTERLTQYGVRSKQLFDADLRAETATEGLIELLAEVSREGKAIRR